MKAVSNLCTFMAFMVIQLTLTLVPLMLCLDAPDYSFP